MLKSKSEDVNKGKYHTVWEMLVHKVHAMRTFTNITGRITEGMSSHTPKAKRRKWTVPRLSVYNAFILSNVQKILIGHLACARYYVCLWDTAANKQTNKQTKPPWSLPLWIPLHQSRTEINYLTRNWVRNGCWTRRLPWRSGHLNKQLKDKSGSNLTRME
jgi:hypothetical protein